MLRTVVLVLSLPFVAAASPSSPADPSAVPADVVALPATSGSWLATVTIAGGLIGRFDRYAVASDGRASSTRRAGIVELDDTAFARVAGAVAASNDSDWRTSNESTCCDRITTRVTIERRAAHAHLSSSTTQSVESGTSLPPDAERIVEAVESALEDQPAPART